jgi:hypothetical protein
MQPIVVAARCIAATTPLLAPIAWRHELEAFDLHVVTRRLVDARRVYDGGVTRRTVLTEFEGVEQAVARCDAPASREALRLRRNAGDRDWRNVEAAE